MNENTGFELDQEGLRQLQEYQQQQRNDASLEQEPAATAATPQSNDVTKTEKPEGEGQGFMDWFVNGSPEQQAENEKRRQNALESGFMYSQGASSDLGEDLTKSYTTAAERLAAPGMGLVDAAVGAYNWVMPGEDLDIKRPDSGPLAEYSDQTAQTMREISSVVLPELMAFGGAMRLLRGAKGIVGGAKIAAPGRLAKGLDMLENSAALSRIGKTGAGAAAAVGAADVTFDPYNEVASDPTKGYNGLGALKKQWPKFWSFIPEGLAVGADDTPEEKRAKNKYEALVGAGIEPLISGVARLFKGSKGVQQATTYVAESENAIKRTEQLNKAKEAVTGDPALDKVIKEQELYNKDLDDYGAFMLDKMQSLDQPIKGIHDMYDVTELGLRTRDADGALGAMDDVYRITNDVDSWNGRVGSMFTSAAGKYGNEIQNVKKEWLVTKVMDEILENSDITSRLPSGKKITAAQRDLATANLYRALVDDYADGASVIELMSQVQKKLPTIVGAADARAITSQAMQKAAAKYSKDYLDLTKAKANALIQTSTAGQVADMAETASKITGKVNPTELEKELVDRLRTFLIMKEIEVMDTGQILADMPLLQRWALKGDERALNNIGVREKGLSREAKIEARYKKVNQFIDTLEDIRVNKPHWMKPLMDFYAATDGRVSSMYQMNNVIQQSLGKVRKALIDNQPEFPQLILQEMQSNLYNSTLSAVTTAFNMTVGNLGGAMDHFFSPFAGALASGDFKAARVHASSLAAMYQQLGSSLKAGRQRFMQLSTDPDNYTAQLKPDFVAEQSKLMDALESASDAAIIDGNDGIAMALQQRQQLHALATDPLMRFVPNIGGANDAITQSQMAWYGAHRRAYDEFFRTRTETSLSQLPAFGKKRFMAMRRKIYRDMYDENGVLRDPLTLYQSGELTMTNDNALGDMFNALTKKAPATKAAFMFPRMMGAMVKANIGTTPISLMGKMGSYARKVADMSMDEIQQTLKRNRIDVPDEMAVAAYQEQRYKIRGRVMTGAAMATGGIMMAMNDRLHGNGHYDSKKQAARGKNWAKSSFLGTDGKWHSHKALGPISTLLDFIADVQDNFDLLGEQPMEKLDAKLAFIFGGLIDDANMRLGVQPIFDILEGRSTAMQRLAANIANSGMSMAGLRRNWSDFLDPQLREIQRDFGGYLRAANGWLDPLFPELAAPEMVSMSGEVIRGDLDIWTRMRNAFTPFKVSNPMTPEESFLVRVEYPMDLNFDTVDKVKLNPTQQAELAKLVFTDSEYQRGLKRIVENYRDYYKFEEKLGGARGAGDTSVDTPISKFFGLHSELDQLVSRVRDRVAPQLSDWTYIQAQKSIQALNQRNAERGQPAYSQAAETEQFLREMNP